jgi:hypothetical protein
MVKVIVRKAPTGVAAVSTLLVAAGSGNLGCAAVAEPSADESVAEGDLELGAGSAVLELGYTFGQPTEFGLSVLQSTTDEFIRVGEELTVSIPGWLLWQELYPETPLPDTARLKQISATLSVRFYDKAFIAGSFTKPTATWSGSDPNDLDALTEPFVVPAKTDTIMLHVTIKDAMDPSVMAELPVSLINPVAVFGGELPKKTLFFDNVGAKYRQRIIEGDNLVAGSSALIAVSDWRADAIADKGSLDAQIGTAQGATRFGVVTVPIYGKLVHEVSYAVSFNDGLGWRPEAPLAATALSRLLGPGRTSFEANLLLPAKASRMSLYTHVKTYLIADYTPYNNVIDKWFSDNEKVLKADKYDNPFGPFTNYDYNLQQ